MKSFLAYLRDENGQTSTEYILLVAVVAVVAVVAAVAAVQRPLLGCHLQRVVAAPRVLASAGYRRSCAAQHHAGAV